MYVRLLTLYDVGARSLSASSRGFLGTSVVHRGYALVSVVVFKKKLQKVHSSDFVFKAFTCFVGVNVFLSLMLLMFVWLLSLLLFIYLCC